MKSLLAVLLLMVCATACADQPSGPFGRIRLRGGPELTFAGSFTAKMNDAGPRTILMTYIGRTIRYEQDALYVDDRQLELPVGTRVVAFDGPDIYVDGREIGEAAERR
jgi:hypothetical protein